jgi:hypothetical protein
MLPPARAVMEVTVAKVASCLVQRSMSNPSDAKKLPFAATAAPSVVANRSRVEPDQKSVGTIGVLREWRGRLKSLAP